MHTRSTSGDLLNTWRNGRRIGSEQWNSHAFVRREDSAVEPTIGAICATGTQADASIPSNNGCHVCSNAQSFTPVGQVFREWGACAEAEGPHKKRLKTRIAAQADCCRTNAENDH